MTRISRISRMTLNSAESSARTRHGVANRPCDLGQALFALIREPNAPALLASVAGWDIVWLRP
jgi:hypothetical protein